MSTRLTTADLPKSLGAFKPTGHVMVALPDAAAVDQAMTELLADGFEAEDLMSFSAGEGAAHMKAMLEDTSALAGFGFEVNLMHRYVALAHDGKQFLLVYAPSDEQGQKVQKLARKLGAPMAVKYHLLAVEDLV